MIKIYLAYIVKIFWDISIMLAFLYAAAWAFFGPRISEIGTEIVKEVIKNYG